MPWALCQGEIHHIEARSHLGEDYEQSFESLEFVETTDRLVYETTIDRWSCLAPRNWPKKK